MENVNEEYIEERNCYIYADVKYTIRSEKRDEFVKKLLEEHIITSSRCEPGNIKYEVSVPVDSVDEVCISELWTNKTEQKRHAQAAHYEKLAELKKYTLTEILKNEVDNKALRRCMHRNYKDFKMERRRLRMNDKNSMDRISPCGLHCGKCFAFEDGDIHAATMKLKENLGAFEPYALRFIEQLDPVFEKYPDFKEMLDYFANASCKGCRKEECKFYKNCNVRACTVEKGIDFCYECNEFPCEHSGLDKNLHKRSVTINRRIQKIGLDEYYEEVKNQPRY